MASLVSLGLLSLLTSIPLSAAAPAKRQFGPGGYGRPNYRVGPPWFASPNVGIPSPDSSPDAPAAISTPTISVAPAVVTAPAQPADPIFTTNTPAGQASDPITLLTVPTANPPASTIAPAPTILSNTIVLTPAASLTTDAAPSNPPAQFSPSTQPTFANATVPAPSSAPAASTQPPFSAPANTNTNTAVNIPPAVPSNTQPATPAVPAPAPSQSAGGNITVSPGNTLNGTVPGNVPPSQPPQSTPGLNVELVNNFGSSGINLYVTAKDETGRVMILTPSQTWFYPSADSSDIPQPIGVDVAIPLGAPGQTTTLSLPGYFASGRIYFSAGTLDFYTLLNPQGVTLVAPDPMNPSDAASQISWSFVEMTYSSIAGLFANLSFVDFLGLPVGMSLSSNSGAVQTVEGTDASAMPAVCGALAQKAAEENVPWDRLCEYSSSSSGTSQLLRVDSPGKYIAARDNRAFETYWDAYVTAVWARYAAEPLYIDAQNELGVISCSTASGLLACTGASRPLPAPLSTTNPNSALDIFACSGIFSTQPSDNAVDLAVLPRVCAALNRATLLLPSSSPPSSSASASSGASSGDTSSGDGSSGDSTTNNSTTIPSSSTTGGATTGAGTGGNIQPGPAPSTYYATGGPPANWYAKAVHDAERDGKGYAFAYDDVYPSSSSGSGSVDVSGAVSLAGGSVGVWRVFVGGMTG